MSHFNPLTRLRAKIYYWRGNMHRHWGNLNGDVREYQSAVDNFGRALNLHPAYAAACFNRGVLYWRELQNYYRAVKDLTRVIDLAPHWPDAWYNRAMAHQLRNEWPEAIADYEHYLTLPGPLKYDTSAQLQMEWVKLLAAKKAARLDPP